MLHRGRPNWPRFYMGAGFCLAAAAFALSDGAAAEAVILVLVGLILVALA